MPSKMYGYGALELNKNITRNGKHIKVNGKGDIFHRNPHSSDSEGFKR